MKALTQKSATSGQVKQTSRVASDAAEKAVAEFFDKFNPDAESTQRIHARGGEFTSAIHEAVIISLKGLAISNQYADEEVESRYGYLSGFKPGVMDLDRQVAALQGLFPGLGGANQEYVERIRTGTVALPNGAEKFGAVPNWKKRSDLFGGMYNEAVQKTLDQIEKQREGRFANYRKGRLGPNRLRQSKRSEEYWNKLIEEQGNPDILIIPFQFGIRHRGRSVRRVREVISCTSGEFGLGAFAVGMLLLTHPERLKHYDDLWTDCAGDEYDDPGAGVRFGHSPRFLFSGGGVGFGTGPVAGAGDRYGSPSGFVPQDEPCTSQS